MTIIQALLLGLLQGITEFLPISSSGHLVLAESWLGLEVQQLLSFDVVLHAGTLIALIIYFRKTLREMVKGLWIDIKRMLRPHLSNEPRDQEHPREQVWYLIVATLPIVLLGPFLRDIIEVYFREPSMVVMMLGVTAILLALAETIGRRTQSGVSSIKNAFLIGFFQVLAVIPGISRSGSTIVGGLLGNLEREAAAKFAFLMAIPAIAGATIFLSGDLLEIGWGNGGVVTPGPLMVGLLASMISSFACVHGMLRFLKTRSLWWFIAYLVLMNLAWFVL